MANLSTYFKFPEEFRRLIYTTNAIEGFNRLWHAKFCDLRKDTQFPYGSSYYKLLNGFTKLFGSSLLYGESCLYNVVKSLLNGYFMSEYL